MLQTTFEKIERIARNVFNMSRNSITPESTIATDLKADNIDLIDLIMAVEDAFDLEISDDDAEKFATIGDIVKYVDEHHKSS
jgi:acyl carrier protein